jgi:cysteine desulfurase
MAINNEIGVVQPLAEIGALCRRRGVFFHTDAAQAAGKVPLDVNALNVDAMSISGHKVSAARCMAGDRCCVCSHLTARHPDMCARVPRRNADLWTQGRWRHLPAPPPARAAGPHHQRRRPGARLAQWHRTHAAGGESVCSCFCRLAQQQVHACVPSRPRTPGAHASTRLPRSQVGLGAACDVARTEMARDEAHVRRLSERLLDGLRARLPHIVLNGDAPARYPGNLNISFAFVEGESLLMGLKDIAVSSGSACTSASLEPSYVLRALGVEEDLAHTSLRFGLGRFTTEREVDYAIDATARHVQKLRDMSPLWEMVQEGIDLKSINWTQHH